MKDAKELYIEAKANQTKINKKIMEFMQSFELVFRDDFDHAKAMMEITADFFDDETSNNWGNHGSLLNNYRALTEMLDKPLVDYHPIGIEATNRTTENMDRLRCVTARLYDLFGYEFVQNHFFSLHDHKGELTVYLFSIADFAPEHKENIRDLWEDLGELRENVDFQRFTNL